MDAPTEGNTSMSNIAENVRSRAVFLVSITLGVVMGGLPAVISTEFLPYFIGACVLLAVGLLSLSKPLLLLCFMVLTSALSGLLRSFESLSFGTTSLTVSGFRWVSIAGITLFVIGVNIRRTRLIKHFLPFVIFVLWVIARWVGTTLNTTGLKDILFYGLPPLIGVYTLLVLSASKKPLVEKIEAALLYSVSIPLFLYAFLIPSGLVYVTQKGPVGLLDPRATAQYLLVVLSLSLAQWRYAINNGSRRRGILVSLLALSIIVFTLSRIATATALLLFAIFRMNAVRLWKVLLSGLLAVILVASLLLGIPSFRARLFHQPPSNLKEAFEYLNMMGRDKMWPAAFNHALENPVWGWGPGSARLLVADVVSKKGVKEWHPHNEYLQVFHDTGIIGLALLLSAWFPTLFRYWKRWRFAHLSGDILRAKWNMAATLGTTLVLINSVADNTLHYANVLVPIFLILSCAAFLNSSWPSIESHPSYSMCKSS
jgi:O-antigen ligase